MNFEHLTFFKQHKEEFFMKNTMMHDANDDLLFASSRPNLGYTQKSDDNDGGDSALHLDILNSSSSRPEDHQYN